MANTALGRSEVALLTNKSGGSVAQGDVVIVDTANTSAFTTTTSTGYTSGRIGVVLEPNGIANNGIGLIAFGGYVPVINLSGTGNIGDLVKVHSVAKQGVRHTAPQISGDFAQVLATSATPPALLFGTVQLGAGSGVARSGSTTDGHMVLWDGSNADAIKDGDTFAANLWSQVVNESGASFANFTAESGTWSSDGTEIKQTDTAATVRRAKFNTKLFVPAMVMQADVQIKSSTADAHVGILLGFAGTGTGGLAVHLRVAEDDVRADQDGVASGPTFSATINLDTWYTLRCVALGATVAIYLDSVLLGTARITQANKDTSFIGLRTYKTEGWFKNIKAWTIPLPA